MVHAGSLHPQDERGLWFARALAALCLALVVHVSLVPADFGVGGRRFVWHLVGMVLSLAPHHLLRMTLHGVWDFAANVLLYVPLGLLLPWTQRPGASGPAPRAVRQAASLRGASARGRAAELPVHAELAERDRHGDLEHQREDQEPDREDAGGHAQLDRASGSTRRSRRAVSGVSPGMISPMPFSM